MGFELRRFILVALTVGALSIQACSSASTESTWNGGSDPAFSSTSSSQVSNVSADGAVQTYFDAIASSSAPALESALSVAKPSSAAERYLRFQLAIERSGTRYADEFATYDSGTVTLCARNSPQQCRQFEQIKLSNDGLVDDFLIMGQSVGQRLRDGESGVAGNGMTAK
jgi:hypothetical protein